MPLRPAGVTTVSLRAPKMPKEPAASMGLHSTMVDVVLWALAQHADPTVEAIQLRWGVDRATCFRWKVTLDDARARWSTMQRRSRPIEVIGRSAVTEEGFGGLQEHDELGELTRA